MNTTPSPKMFPRMSLMSSAAPDPELAGAAAGAPEAGAGCFAVNESGAGVTEDADAEDGTCAGLGIAAGARFAGGIEA